MVNGMLLKRGTENGERGTGKMKNWNKTSYRELDVKLLIAGGFKLVFFFSIVRLIYSFLASREASFHDIRRAGGNFLSARRIP